MDYEKKYKEALKRAKEKRDEYKRLDGEESFVPSDIEYIFPELKESEDERMINFIKKQLFNIKKTITEDYEHDTKLTEAIDWLEKQGEQKPAWSGYDEAGLGEALWAVEQARSIAKDENDMGNLWYAERWLKSLKEKMKGE